MEDSSDPLADGAAVACREGVPGAMQGACDDMHAAIARRVPDYTLSLAVPSPGYPRSLRSSSTAGGR